MLLALGAIGHDRYQRWQATAPERIVAAMPGVGAGWLDMLRRVAGPATVDTIIQPMLDEYGDGLLGMFENWHVLISIRPDLRAYTRNVRSVCREQSFDYMHPVTTANPPAVVAHEFGHRLQLALGRPLPKWAFIESEQFADRFARAMLALRGWDDPDPKDAVLNAQVRYRLWKSYQEDQ